LRFCILILLLNAETAASPEAIPAKLFSPSLNSKVCPKGGFE